MIRHDESKWLLDKTGQYESIEDGIKQIADFNLFPSNTDASLAALLSLNLLTLITRLEERVADLENEIRLLRT